MENEKFGPKNNKSHPLGGPCYEDIVDITSF